MCTTILAPRAADLGAVRVPGRAPRQPNRRDRDDRHPGRLRQAQEQGRHAQHRQPHLERVLQLQGASVVCRCPPSVAQSCYAAVVDCEVMVTTAVFGCQVVFPELCFIRFQVYDTNSSHVTAQRIIPLKCLKPGKSTAPSSRRGGGKGGRHRIVYSRSIY